MKFDGPTFARAWLAVSTAASSARNAPPSQYKTVTVEGYEHGLRLTSTDGFMLLVCAIPDVDVEDGREPSIDMVPDWTVVASDADGLAKQLLAHVLTVAARIDKDVGYEYGELTVSINIDSRPPPPKPKADQTIEGLEPRFVVLTVPDVESVHLEVIDTAAVDWRPVFHEFTAEETREIKFNPEFVERLGRVRKYAEGSLVWRFGGAGRIALVDWPTSDPHIEGAVVPRRDPGGGSG